MISKKKLKEILDYNPDTGIFTWKISIGSIKAGREIRTINKGYIIIQIDRVKYKGHQLAFLYMQGYIPALIDHIDRNRSNNKWDNLREVNHTCSIRNRGVFKNNVSRITGVGWHKQSRKWRTRIDIYKEQIHLGSYKNFDDAVLARWRGEIKYGFMNCYTVSPSYLYLKENNLI